MNKQAERRLLEHVYGACKDWDVLDSEAPDFICIRNGTPVLGIEVTDLFSSESEARLNNIEGYAVHLINGGAFRHKDDVRGIRVEKVTFIKEGQSTGREIMAVIMAPPGLAPSISLLSHAIKVKEQKVRSYLASCPMVDLLVNDAAHLFSFENYEHLFFALYRHIDKTAIIGSKFREVILVTSNKEHELMWIPLKLNLFAADIHLFEHLIREVLNLTLPQEKTKAFKVLFHCLSKSGYGHLSLTAIPNGLGIAIGSCEYRYTGSGKQIVQRSTTPESMSASETIGEIEMDADPVPSAIAVKVLEEKEKYRCCLDLVFHSQSRNDVQKASQLDRKAKT